TTLLLRTDLCREDDFGKILLRGYCFRLEGKDHQYFVERESNLICMVPTKASLSPIVSEVGLEKMAELLNLSTPSGGSAPSSSSKSPSSPSLKATIPKDLIDQAHQKENDHETS
ncbi:MAG: hypothetical protein AAF570_02240, partial [Bacteroidota bacterium]